MKLKIIAAYLSSSLLAIIPLLANAKLDPSEIPLFSLAQEHCTPGTLTIEKYSPSQTLITDCKWHLKRKDIKGNIIQDKYGKDLLEDTDMQITLQMAPNVDMVGMHCIFIPAKAQPGKMDSIADISVSGAASRTGRTEPEQLSDKQWLRYVLDKTTGKTDIYALISNYRNVYDDNNSSHSHGTVLFDLNTPLSDRSWGGNNIPFNDNDTLKCAFAPNLIPYLSVENSY
jgi:hypothetical protein